jgi:TonB family protein
MTAKHPDSLLDFAPAKGVRTRRLNLAGGALTLLFHAVLIAGLAYAGNPIRPAALLEQQSIDVSIIPPTAEISEARAVIQPKMVRLATPVVTAPDIEIEPEPSPITVSTALAPPSLDMAAGNAEQGRSDYVGRLHQHLMRFMQFPGAAGSVTLRFFVDKAGMVHSLSVAKSSGKKAVDEAALALVKRAEPLPPVPEELKVELFGASLPVLYEYTRTANGRLNRR